jgi:ferredoxin-NADP reductase
VSEPGRGFDAVTVQVAAKAPVSDDVVSLTLTRPDGGRLPDWAPGAHIDVVLPSGMTRQYSLCGDRWDAHSYRVAVLREQAGRGGSAYVHDQLAVGDLVGVGGPQNNFRLVPSGKYLFIAGGVGITPLLPMIYQAELLGADWNLTYGGRRRSSMAFLEELTGYGQRVRIVPQDEYGLLDLASLLGQPRAEVKVYCCGPPPLLEAVGVMCAKWPPHSLHAERFVPKELAAPVRDASFQVELARSGRTVTVGRQTSVLAAARDAGVNVLSSCQEGVCGTCETAVLAGRPDHRDSILDDDERAAGDCMFICVSRSCTDRLVLDL